jgi:DNA-binding NarL/FixJ family response regulator
MNTYSLEQLQENGYEVGVDPDILSKLEVDDFKSTLTDRQLTILELNEKSFTNREIADIFKKMSYSTICREMRRVAQKYISFKKGKYD